VTINTSADLISFADVQGHSCSVVHIGTRPVTRPCSLSNPCLNGFSFYAQKRWTKFEIDLSRISLLFVANGIDSRQLEQLGDEATQHDASIIVTKQPRLLFLEAISKFFVTRPAPGIHPSATVPKNCEIADCATVQAGVRLGENVCIGKRTIISQNCVIGDDTRIGSDCFIAPGVSVGQPGFGYERDETGKMIHFPHIGNVTIGNNVEIGANTCIDRGTLDSTVISDGVKIDNLCHISHNVHLEPDCVVIANSMVGGSTRIGERSWVSPSCSILNGLSIGADAMVGMGSVVVKPVPPTTTVLGVPAIPIAEFLENKKRLANLHLIDKEKEAE
jgi:UDP-3-O-[3-hydroxymyristoyl] glucosamine N-acyltransferase